MAAAVAVHRLNDKHRDDIALHLLQLPENDRRLRFGRAIRDDAMADQFALADRMLKQQYLLAGVVLPREGGERAIA